MGYQEEGHFKQENSKCKGPVAGPWLACLGSRKEAKAGEPLAGKRPGIRSMRRWKADPECPEGTCSNVNFRLSGMGSH